MNLRGDCIALYSDMLTDEQ